MGHGRRLHTANHRTPYGRLSGLTCWENFMPLARYYLYSQGVDIWAAPTLAASDGWIAAMRHIALEGRCYVIGVNPCLHVDQIPVDFPHRDRLWVNDHDNEGWVEPGNSVIIHPTGKVLSGPARHEETILYADVELAAVRAARRFFLRPSRPLQPPRHLPTPGGYPLPTCGRTRSHVGQPDARRADREAGNSEPVMRGSQPLRMQVDCSLTRSRRSAACHSAQFVTNRRALRHKSITTASSISTPAAVSVKILPSLGSHRFLPHRRRDTSRRP